MNVQDLADALSGAYDRGYAQGKADALAAQPEQPVPGPVRATIQKALDALEEKHQGDDYIADWIDEIEAAGDWLDAQRPAADEGSGEEETR